MCNKQTVITRAIFIMASLLLSSCEKFYTYHYKVSNKTDDTILISYTTYHPDDSTMFILVPVDSTKQLIKIWNDLPEKKGPHVLPPNHIFKTINVQYHDKGATSNLLDETNWMHSDDGSSDILYTLTITNQDF